MERKKRALKFGFTLIELMVVVSIISLLASIVLGSVTVAREKARDVTRLSHVRSIQTVLALYYDKYGYYPRSHSCYNNVPAEYLPSPNAHWCNSVSAVNLPQWLRNSRAGIAADVSEFFPGGMPLDPLNSATAFNGPDQYGYWYYSGNEGIGNNQGYLLRVKFEDKAKETQITQNNIKGTNCTNQVYSVNQGALFGVSPPACP